MNHFSRRGILKGMAISAFASGGRVFAKTSASCEYPRTRPATGDVIRVSAAEPVVEMQFGRIRGYTRNGVFIFKAVPYGADTSGANRFRPPQKPASWTGIRNCLYHGFVSPQPPRGGWRNNEEAWLFSWDDGIQSEDCLTLNLWTPGLDGAKRPVMVWLHGGGFTAGSATELPSYDGQNLAQRGDVVVVSVSHRLNVFGFLNVSSCGEDFASSGNVGMLDIVAALEWVRDNISRFGGDPNRVTIFGQSGGGGKVSTLMAMPAAKGLFHHAIVESGSMGTDATMESSHELTELLFKQLNLEIGDIKKLQEIPFANLELAAIKATAARAQRPGLIGMRRTGMRGLGWQPVSGNLSLPVSSFLEHAPELSAKVPLLVGTTLNEFTNAINMPDAFKMTEEQLHQRVKGAFDSDPDPIVDTFRRKFSGANPFQLWSVIATAPMRRTAVRQARLKHEQGESPAYLYRFDWQTPVLDGRPMAFHCSEIAFAFDNVARCENMTGNGPAAHALAERVSRAWISFARSGNPNHEGLPHWEPFTSSNGGSMVFDNECLYQEHLDDELLNTIPDV
jgi:para-nitrobenzyl esterase